MMPPDCTMAPWPVLAVDRVSALLREGGSRQPLVRLLNSSKLDTCMPALARFFKFFFMSEVCSRVGTPLSPPFAFLCSIGSLFKANSLFSSRRVSAISMPAGRHPESTPKRISSSWCTRANTEARRIHRRIRVRDAQERMSDTQKDTQADTTTYAGGYAGLIPIPGLECTHCSPSSMS